MAKIKALPIALAVASALTAMSTSAVEFHGYARAGLSTTSDGGEQTCYGSGGAGHFTGRLGGECETYIEIDLQQEVYNRDGKVFRVEAMYATETLIGGQGNDYQALPGKQDPAGDSPWDGAAEMALRQMFATAKGVVGWAPEATMWAGKRFYQRKDVHWLDLFYVNNSGYGVGLEGIDAGPGKLSVAWTNFDQPVADGTPNNANGVGTVQTNKIDLRYAGIPLWTGASLELIGIASFADPTDSQDGTFDDEDGFFFTGEISHPLMGGFNKIVVQYGVDGMASSAFDNHGAGNALNRFWGPDTLDMAYRIMDFGVIKLGSDIEMGYSALYQYGEINGSSADVAALPWLADDEAERMSFVIRPMYKWNDIMKTTIEIGYDDVETQYMSSSEDLYKFIIAQEWTAGRSFWARPTIRLYTGSFWGDQAENNTANDPSGDDGNIRFGAQLEAWW